MVEIKPHDHIVYIYSFFQPGMAEASVYLISLS